MHLNKTLTRISTSIWLYPAVLTLILITLTVLKVNGSSIGIYKSLVEGTTQDSKLLIGQPRMIRSDEWVVNTPLALSQAANGYKEINTNIGNGQDMSVIVDVPYKSWSEIFKPHNWAFFVLPFDNAFAFKWWFMGYAVLLSSYFLALVLMPRKKIVAILVSVSLAGGAFLQWWYQYITLGPIYYSLLIALITVYMFKVKSLSRKLMLGVALGYVCTCFALVLYPPFQIPCLIVIGLFLLGYILQQRQALKRRQWRLSLAVLAGGGLLSIGLIGLFLVTRIDVIHAINDSAYPGHRIVSSGGYSLTQLLSGTTGYQFTSDSRAAAYNFSALSISNQSEASSFLFLGLLTVPISVYYYVQSWRKKQAVDYAHIGVILGTIILLAWMFVPHLGIIGKLTVLDRVPLNRTIIGLGLANFLLLTLFTRQILQRKQLSRIGAVAYSGVVLGILLVVNLHIHRLFPDFLGHYRLIAFALPLPLALFLLLNKYYRTGLIVIAVFTVMIGVRVNPLYRGTDVLSRSPVITAIQNVPDTSSGRWVSELGTLESFPLVAGKPSLSGVYDYPQNSLWKPIDNGKQSVIYNRYAQVNFVIDKDPARALPTSLLQPTADRFGVVTEACGQFLRDSKVRFILTSVVLQDSCLELVSKTSVPLGSYYIYRIQSGN